jgi:hypothetical protein
MTAAYGSIIFGGVFLLLLTLLHFLNRELDPAWRMISEYEMLAATMAIWPSVQTSGGVIGRWWLLVIVIFLFGAGIFKTDPITEQTNSLVNKVHSLCGTVVILTFPIAATLTANSLMRNPSWLPVRGLLVLAVVLVWVGMIAYFGTIIRARSKNAKAGEDGTRIYMGWPNRFNVLTYLIWIFIVAGCVIHLL